MIVRAESFPKQFQLSFSKAIRICLNLNQSYSWYGKIFTWHDITGNTSIVLCQAQNLREGTINEGKRRDGGDDDDDDKKRRFRGRFLGRGRERGRARTRCSQNGKGCNVLPETVKERV